jgi:methylmalonyl-CoA mutase
MLDFADVVAINKFDKRGSLDALRDVRKQYKRNHNAGTRSDEDLPVYGTVASQFADPGTERALPRLMDGWSTRPARRCARGWCPVGPRATGRRSSRPSAVRYLAEIAESSDRYNAFCWPEQSARGALPARRRHRLLRGEAGATSPSCSLEVPERSTTQPRSPREVRARRLSATRPRVQEGARRLAQLGAAYRSDVLATRCATSVIEQPLFTESLSRPAVPKVSLPRFHDWGDSWSGCSPRTCRELPLRRRRLPAQAQGEDPARMFAGEGGPERTNKRFHYVSRGMPAKRLSTAFDSRHALRRGPRPAPGHLRQGRQQRRHLLANVDDAKKLYSRLRPHRPGDQRLDDHQRSRADAAGVLHERRHRPALREVHPRTA